MRKSTVLLLMLGMSTVPLFAAEATSEMSTLKKQIDVLQKQLEAISKQVNEQSKQVKEIKSESKHVAAQQPAIAADTDTKKEATPQFDKGYFALPGTTVGLKVGGMVKLDMIRDGRANTSEQTNVGRLPYDLQTRNPSSPNSPMSWKEHYNIHAKQSRIRIDSVAKNSSGTDTKAFIEGDFFGTTHWGDAVPGGTTGNTTNSSNTYTFRVRHAVLQYGGLEAGHTATTFHLDEVVLPSVDLNGIYGGVGRHALIRYTQNFANFSVTAAAEQGRGDYVTYSTATATTAHYVYNAQDATSSLSKQTRPDLIMRMKYNFNNGSVVGFSVVNRDLQIKNNSLITGNAATTVDGRGYKASGWGANLAAKIMTFGKSFFTGGVATGKGIGWYILDAHGRSAFFDPTVQQYKAIRMTMLWAGYSQVWNDQWQTNIGVAQIKLDTQSLSDNRRYTSRFEPGLDKTFSKFIINTMYKPTDSLEFGLEYFSLQRKSTLKHRGLGQRLQFAVSYKF